MTKSWICSRGRNRAAPECREEELLRARRPKAVPDAGVNARPGIASPVFSVRLVLRRAEEDLACFRIVLTRRRRLNVGEHLQRALDRGARVDPVEPLLDPRELGPVDPVALAGPQPR